MKYVKASIVLILLVCLTIGGNSQIISSKEYVQLDSLFINKSENVQSYIDSLVKIDTCNAKLLYYKANLFDLAKKTDLALHYYFKVINIDTTITYAYYNLGVIYYNKGIECYHEQDPITIEQYLTKYINAENYFNISKIFFERALLLDPSDLSTREVLAAIKNRLQCMDRIKLE